MVSGSKLVGRLVAFARAAASRPLRSAVGTWLGIGHMLPALVVAIGGGRLKRLGTAAGKIVSRRSGQEVPMFDDELTECHIADVKTAAGLVIEFQRSTIRPEEVDERQRFYQRMIWVIDGSRNEFDRINFNNMRSDLGEHGLVDFAWYGRSKLFHRWHTTKPTFIDFGKGYGLWRILRFDPVSGRGRAALVDIDGFVTLASSGTTDLMPSVGQRLVNSNTNS